MRASSTISSSSLERLDLSNSLLTDAAVAQLSKFSKLEALGLRNTQLTPRGLEKLKAALPKTRVEE